MCMCVVPNQQGSVNPNPGMTWQELYTLQKTFQRSLTCLAEFARYSTQYAPILSYNLTERMDLPNLFKLLSESYNQLDRYAFHHMMNDSVGHFVDCIQIHQSLDMLVKVRVHHMYV